MDQSVVEFVYTSYKGVRGLRRAIPRQLVFKSTEHHPAPQWIMVAWCEDRDAIRDFALKDCDFTRTELP